MDRSSGSSRFLWKGVIEAYRRFFPVAEKTPIITLHERNTPLIRAVNLQKTLYIDLDIYFKFDGMNPTVSFKDRPMTPARSKAMEQGTGAVMCACTGNASASAASPAFVIKKYRAGILPKGKTLVCTLTGNGLKDPDTVFKVSGEAVKVKSDFVDVRKMIEKIL